MDFWTRLLGGAGVHVRQSTSSNPQQRLARFKRIYDQIRQTYQKSPLLQTDSSAADTIRTCFQRLTTILQDESRSPAPHLCLSFAASAQIYTTISRIGAVAQNENVIREAVAVFGALIDSEEEEFLANERFSHALMVFVDRTSGVGNLFVGEDTEGEIVELLFGIAAKIRLQPEILSVWFSKREDSAQRRSLIKGNDFVGVTSKEDFPLCYQLIDHVHHEGRIGDFARTGLLYIFESASKSEELEKWIVASDMPTLMASGLGALYSQLSRKLSILHPLEELPIILTLSDYKELKAPVEAESMFSSHLQGHMETFLSYLTFWQDVLEHCRSIDVRHTLLDHFQVLFLQQLLYPSMLESSDVDGGSSVAVLTYLRQILDVLDNVELVNLILRYLLALPEQTRPRSPTALKRRTSLILLTQPENEDDRLNPSLFNLIDLLQSSLTSANPQTVIAALKLATVVLGKNHPYAVNTLLQTYPVQHVEPVRTHGALEAEIEKYLTIAEDVGTGAGFDEAYENQLKDALRLIESHVCSTKVLALNGLSITFPAQTAPSAIGPQNVSPHLVRLDDTFLTHVLSTLETFLTNNIELNLALTEAIITLVSCPHLHLEGWIAVDPLHYHFDETVMEENIPIVESEELRQLKKIRRQPTWSTEHTPLLLSKLQSLQAELNLLRDDFQNLDQLIASRKQAFHLHEEITEAMQNPTLQNRIGRSSVDTPRSPTPGMTAQKPAAIPQRMYNQSVSGSPSRSQSPRGRAVGPEKRQAPTSSPGPPRSVLAQYAPGLSSPGRGSPSRSRPLSGEMQRAPSETGNTEQAPRALLFDVIETANSEALLRRIKFPLRAPSSEVANGSDIGTISDEASEIDSESQAISEADTLVGDTKQQSKAKARLQREASLSHVLTNAVILQEFILELVAIVQVRASMFGEVKFA